MSWFLKYISHHSFTPFVIYRVLLGAAIIGLVTSGAMAPGAGSLG
ncbi:UDP pyrophosphate phosphatase [Streptomyces mirabilis]